MFMPLMSFCVSSTHRLYDPIHLAEDEVEVVHVREGVGLQPIKAEVAAAAVAQHERVFDLVQFPQDTKSHVRNAVHLRLTLQPTQHANQTDKTEQTRSGGIARGSDGSSTPPTPC